MNGQQNEKYNEKKANSDNNGKAKLTFPVTDVLLLVLKPDTKDHENHRELNLSKDVPITYVDLISNIGQISLYNIRN